MCFYLQSFCQGTISHFMNHNLSWLFRSQSIDLAKFLIPCVLSYACTPSTCLYQHWYPKRYLNYSLGYSSEVSVEDMNAKEELWSPDGNICLCSDALDALVKELLVFSELRVFSHVCVDHGLLEREEVHVEARNKNSM